MDFAGYLNACRLSGVENVSPLNYDYPSAPASGGFSDCDPDFDDCYGYDEGPNPGDYYEPPEPYYVN